MNKPCFSFVLVAILLVTAPIASAAGPAPKETRRFALLVGANDGGAGRVELRYAGTDASNLARVLRGLGGFSTRDVILLAGDPDAAAVRTAFASLRTKLAEARKSASRIEVLFYYSGHSDATGLLIAGERIPYAALRHRLDGMTADVTIAILDSCSSGAFTRAKGGTAQPAFLIDESSQVEGYAFISSSSADEVAQESDRIGSSFFTHYFISGLRGAADANRDRQITLNEAYQFTFAETVARTQATRGGVQHPAFRMHLAGTGDVVITDIRDTSATLLVSASVAGRLFVRDGHGDLAVELSKASGRPVRLGLSPGRYRVTLEHGRGTDRAEVILVSGKVTRLEPSAFSAVALEAATARGDAPVTAVPLSISLVPPISTDAIAHAPVHQTIAINLIAGSAWSLSGLSISGAVSLLSGPARGIQLAGFGNVAGEATAIQIGGFGNVVAGPMIGFQAGGFGNFAGGDSRGIQIGGFGNVAGGEMRGIQIGGFGNFAGGDMRGIQIGGFGNSAGTMTGLQIGGFGNSAGTMTGLQLAGGTNVAEHIRGVQLGTVNVGGEVSGLQLGVVNVAQKSDVSIGVVNIIADGYRAAEGWASDTTPLFVGLKSGSRRFYSLLAAGLDSDHLLYGGGFGLHTPRGGYYIDADATAFHIIGRDFDRAANDLLTKVRAMVGFRINDNLALFAGGSLTGAFAFSGRPGAEVSFFGSATTIEDDDVVLRITPGLFAGVQVR